MEGLFNLISAITKWYLCSHRLLHWVLAILSSAGYLSKGLIQFWFFGLSLLLLSFSLWFKQNTSASQLSICQFSWVLNTPGKKRQFITFSQLRKNGWLRRLVMSLDTEVTDLALSYTCYYQNQKYICTDIA